ncbi:MAG: ABC transporter substrate-binding protein [Desulfobacterales bacterium]|nr:ABC transporter substrate-binding protein [Desulfobacterales bacterium]
MKKTLLIIFIIFITLAAILFLPQNSPFKKEVIYIAVVGPINRSAETGKGMLKNIRMLRGINMYLDEINRQGGINGKKIEILVADDKSDKMIARKVASQIALEKKATLVLGHYYSSLSIDAGKIYKKYELPAITGSATAEAVTVGNDWYFSVIPNNNFQGGFIANYINKDLKKTSASIIYSMDDYASSLTHSFEKASVNLGIELKNIWRLSDNIKQDELKQIADEFRASDDPGAVFIATYSSHAAQIISSIFSLKLTDQSFEKLKKEGVPENVIAELESLKNREYTEADKFTADLEATIGKDQSLRFNLLILKHAKYPDKNYSFIGSDSLSGKSFIREMMNYPLEKMLPGYYTDGIYVTSPFIGAIANERALGFRNKFIKKYNTEPLWADACYYDAMHVAVEAIKNADIQGKGHIRSDRRKVREALAKISYYKSAVKAITGDIYFDVDGDIKRPYAIGFYNNQKVVPSLSQYQQLNNLKSVDDVFKKALEGEIILVNGKIMTKTRAVFTGTHINEISRLDISKSEYAIDFYLWFRFQGDFNDADIEFKSLTGRVMGKPVMEETEKGITIRLYHITGDFKMDFDFHSYPFTNHFLPIKFRHTKQARSKLIYVPDPLELPKSFTDSFPALRKKSYKEKIQTASVSEPGWKVKDIFRYQDILGTVSSLGSPRLFNSENTINFSQFNTLIKVGRTDQEIFILTKFAPVIALALLLYTVQFNYISRGRLEIQILISMSVLILNAIYHNNEIISYLQTEYFSAIEYAVIVLHILAGLSALLATVIYRLRKREAVTALAVSSAQTEQDISNYRLQIQKTEKRIKFLALAGQIIYPFIVLTVGFLLVYIYWN